VKEGLFTSEEEELPLKKPLLQTHILNVTQKVAVCQSLTIPLPYPLKFFDLLNQLWKLFK
jgi:hypothetical protein